MISIFRTLRDSLTRVFSPVSRSPQAQARVDSESRALSLYQTASCPYCFKVRHAIRKLGLNIEIRDTYINPQWRRELAMEGGKSQVPCLRIDNGDQPAAWMYESSDIVQYLESRFAD